MRVVVIGAGMGGLAAAIDLARQGAEVTVVERAAAPGGKMREVTVGGAPIDSGPTVFTLRWVFDRLFEEAGSSLEAELSVDRAGLLARHAWSADERLDLHADIDRSAEAIGDFAGAAEARRFRLFCTRAREIYATLEAPFMSAQRPNPVELVRRAGLGGIGGLSRIKPFATLWQALGGYFHDPRLRQLFGRYATYTGSNPFEAPATLMLIAHVEQDGVWYVRGGMHRIARAMAGIAGRHGAAFRYGAEAAEIAVGRAGVEAVVLAGGERLPAEAVVCNADVAAVATGRFGAAAARGVGAAGPERRSLSAVTWSMQARPEGFPLVRHTVFFSRDYRAEFDDIFKRRQLPREPTVYVCAQDRGDDPVLGPAAAPDGAERLFCLVNAPPTGDRQPFDDEEIAQCQERAFGLLNRCGLRPNPDPAAMVATTPRDFERLFPATGGALYGQASHGWKASFDRPGARTRIPGLYLAGGSVHPGAGVPMATLSGRLAADCLLTDRASTHRFLRAATPGGMSTR